MSACPDITCRSCGGTGAERLPLVLWDVLNLWDLGGEWAAPEVAAVLDMTPTAANNRLESLRELGFVDRFKRGKRWIYRLVRSEAVSS